MRRVHHRGSIVCAHHEPASVIESSVILVAHARESFDPSIDPSIGDLTRAPSLPLVSRHRVASFERTFAPVVRRAPRRHRARERVDEILSRHV
tara:strand:- start:255 stop:533 length:279 start_codon:yes stop_codon:yes gene_type:complete